MSATAEPVAEVAPPSLSALFQAFLVMGLLGFGGVLPLARRGLVETRGWLTPDEFNALLSVCQILPGGNVINLSIAVGQKFRGPLGALVCFVGLMAAPCAIVLSLGALYGRYHEAPQVRRLFVGLAAAAAGLLIALALKTARPLWGRPAGLAFAALTFLAIAVLRLPLAPTLVVLALASIAAARRWA